MSNGRTRPLDQAAQALDNAAAAALARWTGSLSPAAGLLAWTDWASHLANAPGKRLALADLAWRQAAQLIQSLTLGTAHDHEPDHRFADPAWQQWPFNLYHQQFVSAQRWWEAATRQVPGVAPHHAQVTAFAARQWLDMFSPGNGLFSNPLVLRQTLKEGGLNLLRGAQYALDDGLRQVSGRPPAGAEHFRPGHEVAVTPGQVVYRNALMELLQYAPSTPTVHPEPVLIVPAWIMKYYILDLSAHNSLIAYLVSQGFTVFCISWKNPGTAERNLGMDDYLRDGIGAALTAIQHIVPKQKIHATGYCLGGTLLAIAAAALARDGDTSLASLSLFTAQTDFSEPGELSLFIDDSQIHMLQAQMGRKGYLSAEQMAGAFQMLRSYDLLWSRLVNEYLLGQRHPMSDLMAWNSDATRMPARMHTEYLHRLFLNNDLAQNRYLVDGRPLTLGQIQMPLFVVGTETDHVAPWRSVYKLHFLSPAELTFVLTRGGHNAGIVSEPGHPRRNYRMQCRAANAPGIPAEQWLEQAPQHEGSWWPAWTQWLATRSGPATAPAPTLGAPDAGYPALGPAPGTYVLD
ncbi:PHA/PHB synthase family protein [Alcaligenes sp. SDU_A2]|uniref:PHA/PHB synthase family protein n=1 Tax=Alcaligenes sp. SDU_A2 TaxID=3136634 RepID=UPI00311E476A